MNLSKKYATRQFTINQSCLLIKWLVTLHSLAVIVAIFTPFPIIYKAITTVLVLVSLVVSLKQENSNGSQGFVLRYTTAFGWEISDSSHRFGSIEILSSTVLTSYMVFLHYRIKHNSKHKQQTKAILIGKDALIDDDFRKLRVELKISGLQKRDS